MKKVSTAFKYCLILSLFFIVDINAQLKDYGIKAGVQINYLIQTNEFFNRGEQGFSFLGRAFLRTELSNQLNVEVGAGYGKLAGKDYSLSDYSTKIIPIDLKLLYTPFDIETWNPYGFIGFGALNYSVDEKTVSVSPDPVDDSGWTGYIPVGLGVEFLLSDATMLDINVGYNYSLTDNLNNYKIPVYNDGYINIGVGIAFITESLGSDRDHDGLTKAVEEELGTDPNNADTDGDGLLDGEEINKYKTDPLSADTDNDNLNDYNEVNRFKTNPVLVDTDKDGLNDSDEVLKHKTDPLKADTDEDNLNDGEEINQFKTSPFEADTDMDGLTDGDEIKKYNTDPLIGDTDDGTVLDGKEIENSTNPLDPTDDIPKPETIELTLNDILFDLNKFAIKKDAETILGELIASLNRPTAK